jgi:23S rRNA pseudouridine2604 synthase
MSQLGMCSRREADSMIEAGQVLVNGQSAKLGEFVAPDANIELSSAAKKGLGAKISIMLNKPVGYVSAHPEFEQIPAVKLLSLENQCMRDNLEDAPVHANLLQKLAVCGRLDQDSRGMLIFTQNGAFAKQLIGEKNIPKEYIVKVAPARGTHWRSVDHQQIIKAIGRGMVIKDGVSLRPAEAEWKDIDVLSVTLLEGKKRQIRHMVPPPLPPLSPSSSHLSLVLPCD